jgi:NAD(P)-dependent dehydrogenase (short-subunit alcohol dehydrogenase family)
MTDRPTIFITGATDGLGRALAHRLAADGAALILHGRDQPKLDQTAAGIAGPPGVDRPRTVLADLADLAQVRKLATDVQRATDRLDVFVSNAGIGAGQPDGRDRRLSADGYELRFAVNYLAGFLLTLELLPLLRASAPARVVNVASIGQHPLDFSDLMLARGYRYPRLRPEQAGPDHVRVRAGQPHPRQRGHRQQPAPGHLHAHQDRPG